MNGWLWHQLGHMQIICTSFQTDNDATTSSLNFYGSSALQDGSASFAMWLIQDRRRAVSASLRQPRDWRRPRGRPRTTWLRGIDADVQSANIGISTQPGGRPKVVFCGVVSSTRQHSIRCTPLKRERECCSWRPTNSVKSLVATKSTNSIFLPSLLDRPTDLREVLSVPLCRLSSTPATHCCYDKVSK